MHSKSLRLNQRIALAKVIIIICNRHNLKLEYIAHQIGLSVSSLYKMEQGHTCIRFTDMYKIGKASKMSLDEIGLLYERELEKMPPSPENED